MSKQKGFTLIELLVVISIISLLSSIVLVSIQGVKERAEQASFRQYLKEVVKAIELYRLENGNIPLIPDNEDIQLSALIDGYLSNYIEKLEEYPDFVTKSSGLKYRTYGYQRCGDFPSLALDEYRIWFHSNDINLNIPHLYNSALITGKAANYYCINSIVN